VTEAEYLKSLPTKRIKAVDGMAVTADVWEEAHDFHRQQLQLHARYAHGPGILSGLEVVASDPADTAIYIRPGAAIDAAGNTIVVAEPLSYDVAGAAEGRLYLLLTFAESRPRSENGRVQEGAPLYVHAEYGLEAVAQAAGGATVELARVQRSKRGALMRDAADAAAPAADEIDLRFRTEIGSRHSAPSSLAVVHLGGAGGRHAAGAGYLARALRAAGKQIWVEDGVTLASSLNGAGLVYLVGHNGFQLNSDEMNSLYAYVQGGGTVFAESCRRDGPAATAADHSFDDLFASLGLKLENVATGHSLLTEPNLFAAPPAGYETEGLPIVRAGGGVVFSAADYGCLWQGERRSGAAGRDAIRTAHEWGGNLLALAEARQRQAAAARP
jgi:Domain of unknown function (DUF4159)